MADRLLFPSDGYDSFQLLMRFVSSLEGGIHSNTFSKRGKRQAAEVKQFIETAGRMEVQRLLATFATGLLKTIQQCITLSFATELRCREASSVAFYQAQQKIIPDLWNRIHSDLSLPIPDPLWTQTVSRLLYEDILVQLLKSKRQSTPVAKEQVPLNSEQENIIRYVAGFVPFKMLTRYKKQGTVNAAAIVDCLADMSVPGEESSFLAYTSEWTAAVNRGGLFEVNNEAYLFFRCVEVEVKPLLTQHVICGTVSEAEILSTLTANEDVLFHWDLLTGTLTTEAQSALLKEFVQLWMTIRVHALTRMLLEEHKHKAHANSAKSKPLRASLKEQ
jgi:hypothetical protein